MESKWSELPVGAGDRLHGHMLQLVAVGEAVSPAQQAEGEQQGEFQEGADVAAQSENHEHHGANEAAQDADQVGDSEGQIEQGQAVAFVVVASPMLSQDGHAAW